VSEYIVKKCWLVIAVGVKETFQIVFSVLL
jgi:hypothetical protein